MGLTKEHIIAFDDLPRIELDIPEWGGTVTVRALMASEAVDFAGRMDAVRKDDRKSLVSAYCSAIINAAIDDDGNALFDAKDGKALERKNFKALERIVEATLKISGMGAADKESEGN